MFKGKKDVLASFDNSSGGGSGGGGGKKFTGGGGNDSSWQPPNWRDLGGQFGKGAQSFVKAVIAILVFAGKEWLKALPAVPHLYALHRLNTFSLLISSVCLDPSQV